MSSHILSEVEKLCDRVAIIRQGQIIENGTLSELRHLARTNIKVQTKKELSLDGLDGIHSTHTSDGYTTFQVETNKLSDTLAHLIQFDIVDLQSFPPSLEELFMSHYQTQGGEVSC